MPRGDGADRSCRHRFAERAALRDAVEAKGFAKATWPCNRLVASHRDNEGLGLGQSWQPIAPGDCNGRVWLSCSASSRRGDGLASIFVFVFADAFKSISSQCTRHVRPPQMIARRTRRIAPGGDLLGHGRTQVKPPVKLARTKVRRLRGRFPRPVMLRGWSPMSVYSRTNAAGGTRWRYVSSSPVRVISAPSRTMRQRQKAEKGDATSAAAWRAAMERNSRKRLHLPA